MSPTSRSLQYLRLAGYLAQVVERWNYHAHIRQDLFQFADILAVREGETLAVQTTSGSNVAARRAKLANNPNVSTCLKAGWRCEIHGWCKRKVKRGGKAYRYQLRTIQVTETDEGT